MKLGRGSVFFFQAEDGIRDSSVTGVQTCALPIYYVAGFHGPLDLQPEESHEVLQGIPASRRQADTILRIQHYRLPRASPGATGSPRTRARPRPQDGSCLCAPAGYFSIPRRAEVERAFKTEVNWPRATVYNDDVRTHSRLQY